MIQIPEKLKPENFIIETTIQNENNEIINKPTQMPHNNFTIKEIRDLFFIEYQTMFKREFKITDGSS